MLPPAVGGVFEAVGPGSVGVMLFGAPSDAELVGVAKERVGDGVNGDVIGTGTGVKVRVAVGWFVGLAWTVPSGTGVAVGAGMFVLVGAFVGTVVLVAVAAGGGLVEVLVGIRVAVAEGAGVFVGIGFVAVGAGVFVGAGTVGAGVSVGAGVFVGAGSVAVGAVVSVGTGVELSVGGGVVELGSGVRVFLAANVKSPVVSYLNNSEWAALAAGGINGRSNTASKSAIAPLRSLVFRFTHTSLWVISK